MSTEYPVVKPARPARAKDPEKTVDLPPYGARNADPITDSPGSHPIETGVGAAIGGIASGAALGAVGGPVGAIIGGIVGGAVAGGLAGKGVGELIDPTTEDNWIRDYKTDTRDGDWETAAREAYRFGIRTEARHIAHTFDEAEPAVSAEFRTAYPDRAWSDHRRAVRDGFDRARLVRRAGD